MEHAVAAFLQIRHYLFLKHGFHLPWRSRHQYSSLAVLLHYAARRCTSGVGQYYAVICGKHDLFNVVGRTGIAAGGHFFQQPCFIFLIHYKFKAEIISYSLLGKVILGRPESACKQHYIRA